MTDVHDQGRARSLATIVEAPTVHPRAALLVGVDGSERNRAAIRWATHEAEASGRPVRLVCVHDDELTAPRRTTAADRDEDLTVLSRLADDIAEHHRDLTIQHEIAVGDPISVLVQRSADQALLVVGKRGHGTFARLLIGSTSIAVAGRSRVPTVIVPDSWEQGHHVHQPVVVGLDPDDVHTEALVYAFGEARRRGVRLVVTHGWELPKPFRDPATVSRDVADWQERRLSRIRDEVEPFRSAFPGIHVELASRHGHPATVLLDEAASAQLLVLGRQDDGRLGGFPFGSVTRNVLHHVDVPVAVVPTSGGH